MKDIWWTNVQYYIDLILMEEPCSYTMDSRKNNRYFIVHVYMLDNIQACLYMPWVVKKQYIDILLSIIYTGKYLDIFGMQCHSRNFR